MSLKDAQDFFLKVIPFPPGWWQFKYALFDTQPNDHEKILTLLKEGVEENERWKKEVSDPSNFLNLKDGKKWRIMSPHSWVIKEDDKEITINPSQIISLYSV